MFGMGRELRSIWKGTDTPDRGFGCFECGVPGGVAVDEAHALSDWAVGDVYVLDPEHRVVDVFEPQPGGGDRYVTQLTGPEPPAARFAIPTAVAVSGLNGDVLVVDVSASASPETKLEIFRPSVFAHQYELVGVVTGTPAGPLERVTSIATDGADGEIYLAEGGSRTVVQGIEEVSGAVDELDSGGGYLGRVTGTTRPFSRVQSVAVDPTSHDVFVGDFNAEQNRGAVDVFGPDIGIPDVESDVARNVMATGATLRGSVNSHGLGAASCHFAWGPSRALARIAPCSGRVPNGERMLPVRVALSGLSPDTTYFYRLQASNAQGANPGEDLQDRAFTTSGPGIHDESVLDVTATAATLRATIDPHGTLTRYRFHYDHASGHDAVAPSLVGTSVGSGHGDVEVAERRQGLSAATTYHYRVETTAILEARPGASHVLQFYGPEKTFTTEPAGAVRPPEVRQWEMVSPRGRHGTSVVPIGQSAVIQAAADGNGFTYAASSPGEARAPRDNGPVQVLARRGSGRWRAHDIAVSYSPPPRSPVPAKGTYELFSSDLTRVLVQPLSVFAPSRSARVSRHAVGEACERTLLCAARVVGATPDLRYVLLRSTPALTRAHVREGLYQRYAGKTVLVSVLPGAERRRAVEGSLGAGEAPGNVRHAISDDGTRVVWSSESSGVRHLYLRDTARHATIQLDTVKGGPGTGAVAARYQTASSGGSRVFFLDAQRLTEDSGGSDFEEGGDLYECRVIKVARRLSCALTDLTPLSFGQRANVEGVLGASEDGSYVYFVANNLLAPGGVRGACQGHFARPNSVCNLYVRHDGLTTLIAVLVHKDLPAWSVNPAGLPERVSPNGHWLAFMSQQQLTGYDNRDASSGKPDEEVYLYDAERRKLVCASCNPTGGRPRGVEYGQLSAGGGLPFGDGGREVWPQAQWLAANVPTWTSNGAEQALYQPRYLSDSGRLFFSSHDSLLPQDSNGGWDVYQYEPPGVGGCTASSPAYQPSSGGCLALISSGASSDESAFLDASATGQDVFFLTAARPSPRPAEPALAVHDAHECAAIAHCGPDSTPSVPQPCRSGATCLAPLRDLFAFLRTPW
jgi:hypothetical protein